MRLRNIPGSRERILESEYIVKCVQETDDGLRTAEPYDYKYMPGHWTVRGKWNEIFGNDRPVYIEIGMGKGSFIMENARRHPDINYVGIEKYSSVILRAVEKQDEEKLPNLRLVRMDAEYIGDVFAENEVSRIFLNFSDPWPKAKQAKRRLTSRQFLQRYDKILKSCDDIDIHTTALFEREDCKKSPDSKSVSHRINRELPDNSKSCQENNNKKALQTGGIIEFKTDNVLLFDFSLEEAEAAGWKILASTHDLHNDPVLNEENIMTEYEQKFSDAGNKICKMIIARW